MTARGRVIILATIAIGFVALLIIGSSDTEPLDPDSTRPDGTKGFVLLLEDFAGDVEVLGDLPGDDVDVAVLLRDELSTRAASGLDGWVLGGGTLIVADPDSPFVPPVNDIAVGLNGPGRGSCTIAALGDVDTLSADAFVGFETGAAGSMCFGTSDSSFVVAATSGAGTRVSVGGAGIFTNERLDEEDNAVFAVALAAPTSETSVAVLRSRLAAPAAADDPGAPVDGERREVGGGDEGLFDLLPEYLRWVALTLAIAWLVYAMARARRLGRPVTEPQPVRIAGSELVRATGRLLRRADPSDSARLLVTATRHELADGLGLPRSVSARDLAEVAAARCDLDALEIARTLDPPVRIDDAGLVMLTRRLDHILQEVLRVRLTPAD